MDKVKILEITPFCFLFLIRNRLFPSLSLLLFPFPFLPSSLFSLFATYQKKKKKNFSFLFGVFGRKKETRLEREVLVSICCSVTIEKNDKFQTYG